MSAVTANGRAERVTRRRRAPSGAVEHPSRVERLARGKAARAAVPRSAHAGWTLAKAHARSGDPLTISGHLGSGDAVDRTLAAFAQDYADQNDRDYSAFRAAIDSGRLAAQTGL